MIYALTSNLADIFAARKFPTQFHYGPEPLERLGFFSHTIVIQRDTPHGDLVGAPIGIRRNPRLVRVRSIGVVANIFAQSTLPGARINEHEHECDQVVDALIVALYEWGVASGAGEIQIGESRYLSSGERDDVEQWPGVVYLMRFMVPRAVLTRDYDGAAQPTGAPTGVSLVSRVSTDGESFEEI